MATRSRAGVSLLKLHSPKMQSVCINDFLFKKVRDSNSSPKSPQPIQESDKLLRMRTQSYGDSTMAKFFFRARKPRERGQTYSRPQSIKNTHIISRKASTPERSCNLNRFRLHKQSPPGHVMRKASLACSPKSNDSLINSGKQIQRILYQEQLQQKKQFQKSLQGRFKLPSKIRIAPTRGQTTNQKDINCRPWSGGSNEGSLG